MKANDNIVPATAEELQKAEELLNKSPRYVRMKQLHAKQDREGLTPEEAEELRIIVTPKFQEGDVIQEFVRDLKAAKAKGDGKDT